MHAEPHHAQTLPAPTFTHTTAFAASPPPSGLPATSSSLFSSSTLTHGASPFAPHVYVPPSGAPGYAGEGYGGRLWDKGYSEELEQEMRNSHLSPGVPSPLQGQPETSPGDTATYSERGDQAAASGGRGGWGSGFGFGFGSRRGQGATATDPGSIVSRTTSLPGLDNKTGIAKSNSAPMMGSGGDANGNGNGGMGAFIEKKTGKVELLGRKELTTPVLTSELATDVSLPLSIILFFSTNCFRPASSQFPRARAPPQVVDTDLLARPERDQSQHPVLTLRSPRLAPAGARRGAEHIHASRGEGRLRGGVWRVARRWHSRREGRTGLFRGWRVVSLSILCRF